MQPFPYAYRPGQEEMVSFIGRAVRDGRCAVIEAGTGTGKTVASLCGALGSAGERGMKVVYLTRTKSQQRQVVRETAALDGGFLCVGVQGRTQSSCPMMRDDPDLAGGTSEELSKLCSEYKRSGDGGCRCGFYSNLGRADLPSWAGYVRAEGPEPEELARRCEAAGICPYELVKRLLPEADVIAVPYPFVFVPQVLSRFLEWMGVPLSMTVMVVDEAHNLPDYLREVQTYEYSGRAMDLAAKEAEDEGDPEVRDGLTVADVASVLREILGTASGEYLIDDDGMLPPYFLEDELMTRLGVTSVAISRICKAMEEIGDGVEERKKRRGKLPRSYIGSMARFLESWMDGDDTMHVRLVVGGDNPRFQSYCMDPSGASGPLGDCFASVHMSGTLEPLEAYIAELDLRDASVLRLGNAFPGDNLLSLYSGEVSMRYEDRSSEQNYSNICRLLRETVGAARVNTAVFFPSYQFMDRMIGDGILSDLGREVYFEKRGMGQSDLMEVFEGFSMSDGGILFCVTGGRMSEGMDFPDRALEMAVIVGIPYPKPTARLRAMRRYYDCRFGDGMRYTSVIPASRKVRQAMGRVIRSETDRGVSVILDRRVGNLPGIDAQLSDDIPGDVSRFFSARDGNQKS